MYATNNYVCRMRILFFVIALCSSLCFAAENANKELEASKSQAKASAQKNLRFQVGFSAGDPGPLAAVVGIGYKAPVFRIQGMAWQNGEEDFWCNLRGSLAWTFFRSLPFNIDLGVGSGYAFAKAPNGMHQELNKANKAKYVHPYNYEETLDLSIESMIRLYGIFTQISYPVHFFMGNTKPTILWRAGYIFEF